LSRWSNLALAGLLVCAVVPASAPRLRAQPLDLAGIGFTGTVASADSFALVVRADNGKLVTFPIEEPFRVPAGLVPGMRVTVRYEVVDDNRYRLVGVKIASGPMDRDSTTEPPDLSPAAPAAPSGTRQEPAAPDVLPEPQAESEPESPAPSPEQPAPSPTASDTAAPPGTAYAPEPDATRHSPARAATAGLPAIPATSPPGSREITTLLTLLVASCVLFWAALARL
jgi:hypothetical protein